MVDETVICNGSFRLKELSLNLRFCSCSTKENTSRKQGWEVTDLQGQNTSNQTADCFEMKKCNFSQVYPWHRDLISWTNYYDKSSTCKNLVGYKSQASFMLKTISKIQHPCQLKYWRTAFILLLYKSIRQPPEKKQFFLNPVCCEDNYKQLRLQRKQEILCRILSIYSKSKITEP